MTIEFEARADGSRRVRWLEASASIVGGAGAGLLLCRVPGIDPDAVISPWLALAGAAVATAVTLSGRHRRAAGGLTLRVSARGEATISAVRGADGGRAFLPSRWVVGAGVAWITGTSPGGPRRLRLAFGSDALAQAEWRALRRWLRWLERGGRDDSGARVETDERVGGPGDGGRAGVPGHHSTRGSCKRCEASPSRAASPRPQQGIAPPRDACH